MKLRRLPDMRRSTRPIRADVHAHVVRQLVISPSGRTIDELRAALATQRPASRDTIARVLHALVDASLVTVVPEPTWRRTVRLRAIGKKVQRRHARGRTAMVFTPTRALHELLSIDHLSLVSPRTTSQPTE